MKYLTWEEEKTLIKTVHEAKGAERDYVIIETLLNTGLRASELCAVNVGDVRNKSRFYVQPVDMKNGRGRFVPIHVRLRDILHKWLAYKMGTLRESIEDSAPLFVTKGGNRLTRQDLTQSIIEKWTLRSGLTTTKGERIVPLYSSHSLRHTFAIRFLERNGETTKALRSLQKIMGHKSLASTGVYLEATDREMSETMHMMSLSRSRAERIGESL